MTWWLFEWLSISAQSWEDVPCQRLPRYTKISIPRLISPFPCGWPIKLLCFLSFTGSLQNRTLVFTFRQTTYFTVYPSLWHHLLTYLSFKYPTSFEDQFEAFFSPSWPLCLLQSPRTNNWNAPSPKSLTCSWIQLMISTNVKNVPLMDSFCKHRGCRTDCKVLWDKTVCWDKQTCALAENSTSAVLRFDCVHSLYKKRVVRVESSTFRCCFVAVCFIYLSVKLTTWDYFFFLKEKKDAAALVEPFICSYFSSQPIK